MWLRWTGGIPKGVPNLKGLSVPQLQELCDDPERDEPGGENVRAVLTLEPEEGFFLSAQDGKMLYLITDTAGKRKRFRTIESALSLLQDIGGLHPDIGLLQAPPRPGHR